MDADDWVVLSDGGGSDGSSGCCDSASDDGSDDEFVQVHKGGGDRLLSVVVGDAPAPAVAVPQPTPPGSFCVVSYREAFSDSASSSSSPGDKEEDCESEVAEHGAAARGSSAEAPSETPISHGEAPSELASGMEDEEDDETSGEEEEDDDDDVDHSMEKEDKDNDDDDMESFDEDDEYMESCSEEEDTETSGEEEDDDDGDYDTGEDDGYTDSCSEEDDDSMESTSEEEEDDDAESSGEEESHHIAGCYCEHQQKTSSGATAEFDATATAAYEAPPASPVYKLDDIDDYSDDESENGYIDIIPSPRRADSINAGKPACTACGGKSDCDACFNYIAQQATTIGVRRERSDEQSGAGQELLDRLLALVEIEEDGTDSSSNSEQSDSDEEDDDGSDVEESDDDEAATSAAGSQRPEFVGRRSYDDIDSGSDVGEVAADDVVHVAAAPRATTSRSYDDIDTDSDMEESDQDDEDEAGDSSEVDESCSCCDCDEAEQSCCDCDCDCGEEDGTEYAEEESDGDDIDSGDDDGERDTPEPRGGRTRKYDDIDISDSETDGKVYGYAAQEPVGTKIKYDDIDCSDDEEEEEGDVDVEMEEAADEPGATTTSPSSPAGSGARTAEAREPALTPEEMRQREAVIQKLERALAQREAAAAAAQQGRRSAAREVRDLVETAAVLRRAVAAFDVPPARVQERPPGQRRPRSQTGADLASLVIVYLIAYLAFSYLIMFSQ